MTARRAAYTIAKTLGDLAWLLATIVMVCSIPFLAVSFLICAAAWLARDALAECFDD